jgi:Fe(3+) dicitrate transport protein
MLLLSMTPAAARAAGPDAGAAEVGSSAPDGGASGADGGAGSSDGGAKATPDAGAPADGGAVGSDFPPLIALPPEAPAAEASPKRLEELTVVGTRESRTPGSAHVLRPRDLERMDYDNPETVTKTISGVYARGEDGFGLRPNIGIRGTSPDRSKKVTLMEDGILFAPAPYSAPAAYYFPLMTRMELVRIIKGPGAVSFGPQTIGGAIDLVTRSIPADEAGAIDLATGQYGYGKVHGYYGGSTGRAGYVIEGVHLRSTGFKEIDNGGGDTGFEKNEWMWKGRYQLSADPNASQQVGLKLGYADEDSRESYLGLSDRDFRANPYRRYVSSRFDRMAWHRTQAAATYRGRFRDAFTIDAAVYRNDFSRVWRKFNRIGPVGQVNAVLGNPDAYPVPYSVLIGQEDTSTTPAAEADETIYIGPNRREFVSQGVQVVGGWQGQSGPIAHRVEAGVRYHYDRIDRLHTEDGFLMRDGNLVPNGRPTITTANGRAWTNALALHLTDAASWGPLTLTPGVRVELIETRSRNRLTGVELKGPPQRVVIPGVGVYGALTPSLGLLAGVYRGFSPAAPPQGEAADPNEGFVGVQPELAVNYEAGVRYAPPRLRLEAIGFFNDYQNLTSICTIATCGEGLEGVQSNAGRAHIYGAEVFARADAIVAPGYTIPVIAAYTHTRTELLQSFVSPDPTLGRVQVGDELPFVPRHQVGATVAFETPRASLAVAGSYVSAMREHAGQGPQIPSEPFTDPSFILDVTARVPLPPTGQVYVSVRNVLGAEDIAARLPYGARPVAPRWIQVGTKWSF